MNVTTKKIAVEQADGVASLQLKGYIDDLESASFESTVKSLCLQNSAVLVDFSATDGMVSGVLQVLWELYRSNYGRAKIILCSTKPKIVQQLEFSGLAGLFELYFSLAAAKASMRIHPAVQ